MRHCKILIFTANIFLCILLLIAGCTKSAGEPAQTKVESEEQLQTVKLALKFDQNDSITYKVTTDADNSLAWESPDANKPQGFTGGHTGRKSEITFTQQIQSADDKGNAVAKITIKQLKYLLTVKNDITMDFDSSRQQDQQHPLSKLIGQSYTIEMTASGEVSKIIDVNDARAVVSLSGECRFLSSLRSNCCRSVVVSFSRKEELVLDSCRS